MPIERAARPIGLRVGADSRRMRIKKAVVLFVALALTLCVVSFVRALVAPGSDSLQARSAEWVRDHGGGALINAAERVQYALDPPRTGGNPPGLIPGGSTPQATASAPLHPRTHGAAPTTTSTTLFTPAPIAGPVSPSLPTEGQWKTLVMSGTRPLLRAAFIRPDSVHTSYLAAVARMDPSLVRFDLHPGTQEPGHGPWVLPSQVAPTTDSSLIAAFNSAFRIGDARGGFYAEGRMISPLRAGAASLVLHRDGTATVGQWERDFTMDSSVAAVRQNLDLIVDNGNPVNGLDDNTGNRWGATLGNKLFIARSGIGTTKTGDVVYVSGQSLSAATLADVMQRAGVVRGMELDINPDWTSFSYYPLDSPARSANKLLAEHATAANRYETTSTRDFITVSKR